MHWYEKPKHIIIKFHTFIIPIHAAQPCLQITEPANGNMQCTGPPVTNETCTFTCIPGYELVGSSERTCEPDHTWSGEDASCEILECPELIAPTNALVTRPCNNQFMSTCVVICAEGYHVTNESGIQWMQSCVVNNENGSSVYWTEAKSCIGTAYNLLISFKIIITNPSLL